MCRYVELSVIHTLRVKECYIIFVINWGTVDNTDVKEHMCTDTITSCIKYENLTENICY